MSGDFFRYRSLVAAAVGAGVLIGAAGIYLYHQLFLERRRRMLQMEVQRLGSTVHELKEELMELRKLTQLVPRKSKVSFRTGSQSSFRQRTESEDLYPRSESEDRSHTLGYETESEMEMYSPIGSDSELDEFFDLSDDELTSLETDQPKEEDPILAQLFENVDRLLKGDMEEKKLAYSMLLEYYQQHSPNANVLWRLAKATHSLAAECPKDEKKDYVTEGLKFAQEAVKVDNENSEAHKWFAMMVGSRSQFMDIKARIQDGFTFKEHLDIALKLSPEDPILHHLLGRFMYEVAELTWLERKLAGTLFTEPPRASRVEALESFMMADEYSTEPWKENMLYIAKCFIGAGKITEAMGWLIQAADIEPKSPEDEAVEQEIAKLLRKYGGSVQDSNLSTSNSETGFL